MMYRSLVAVGIGWLNYVSILPIYAEAAPAAKATETEEITNDDQPRRELISPVYQVYYENEVEVWLNKQRTKLEDSVFQSYDAQGLPYKSTAYTYDDFITTLRAMTVNGVGGGSDQIFFYIGQTDYKGIVHGLVNVAAFLAHAMAVSIKFDVCDEFNRDKTDSTQKYAISNSCGQWGLSYQDEVCTDKDAYMTCEVDTNMRITAADSLGWDNAPPPLTCGPKETPTDFTGHWDAELGMISDQYPYANRVGVQHVEGCCWWGRGVLMTRGTCAFGKLNQFLGRPAAAKGWLNFYDVDMCIYPELVCQAHDTRRLRWSVGYFQWVDQVELYQHATENLDYMKDLDAFVQSGFVDVNRFIDIVDKALPFGCVESSCLAEEERVRNERRDNFQNLIFNVLDLPFLVESTPFPTPPPTSKPTQQQPAPNNALPPASVDPPTLNWPPPINPPSWSFTRKPTAKPTNYPSRSPTPKPSTLSPSQPPTPRPSTQTPTARPPSPKTPPPTPIPTRRTPRPTNLPKAESIATFCSGKSNGFVGITECTEYLQCVNGAVASKVSCAAGLKFDSTINACNWEAAVTCYAPTMRPTMSPTPMPTLMPTPKPQQPITKGIDLQPPSPAPSPTYKYPPFLTQTMQPTYANQWADNGQPAFGSLDGNGEGSNEPTPSPEALFSYGDPDLIGLPSSAEKMAVSIVCLRVAICLFSVYIAIT